MSHLSLYVSCSKLDMSAASSERRFDKAWKISTVKERLEPIVGSSAGHMRLEIYNQLNELVCVLDNDGLMLGAYPIENYMRLHVVDTNPYRVKNDFNDVSKVEKYEISEEDYSKRDDSVRSFMQRNKLGHYVEGLPDLSEQFKDEASKITTGARCKIMSDDLGRKGTVIYVGKTEFQPGYWVGVRLDEPTGKNDGSVQGKRYFECAPKYGVFVRPNALEIGDFPEDTIDLEEF